MAFRDDFAAFILSHGRPVDVGRTINALHRSGYTGRWYIVLDTDDTTAEDYKARWGAEHILRFDKDDAHTDMADNGGSRAVIVYARNACEHLARELGLSYYIQLDDDYLDFRHRFHEDDTLKSIRTRRMDDVLQTFVDFLDESNALTVAFGQGGDYLGGYERKFYREGLSRKAMNSHICKVGRPVQFVGRVNEDVNTYVHRGNQGELILTVSDFSLNQVQTQASDGGMTGTYLSDGTYAKSFYTVLFCPSAVKVYAMNTTNPRLHHTIKWDHAVPKILSDRHRKHTEAVTP